MENTKHYFCRISLSFSEILEKVKSDFFVHNLKNNSFGLIADCGFIIFMNPINDGSNKTFQNVCYLLLGVFCLPTFNLISKKEFQTIFKSDMKDLLNCNSESVWYFELIPEFLLGFLFFLLPFAIWHCTS